MNNALNIMKSRVLLYCTLLAAVCSCTKSVWQSEDFDIVETNEYVNIYNSKGKWMIIDPKMLFGEKQFNL